MSIETYKGELRLDLGGGLAPTPNHINIDIIDDADIRHDLNNGLPLVELYKRAKVESGQIVVGIRSHHLIEHLDNIIPLMNDCFKIMKKDAELEISTPLAGTTQFWQDPTHKKGFVPESFLYFIEDSPFKKEQGEYGITARFSNLETNISDEWQLEATLVR